MAKSKVKSSHADLFIAKPKKNRKGVHAKTKQSCNKGADNYVKPYGGQGR